MRTVPSFKVTNPNDVPASIVARLGEVLSHDIDFSRYGSDDTNLVRASTYDFSVAFAPVNGVAYILSLTLRH